MTEELYEIIRDPYKFIPRLVIINKSGKKVQLSPTVEQQDILESLIRGDDTLVLKPRQIGSSTIVAAYFFWLIYSTDEPLTVALLSHKLKSSKHLLGMYKTFYYNLPAVLQKPLEVINSTEIRFADSGAAVIAETAGGDGGLRSFTCTHAALSEFAFSPDPAELLATATSALNNGQLVIESTANYFNDAHHQEIMKAERGLANWKFLFFAWHGHKEYRSPVPYGYLLELTEEEGELQTLYDLSDEQIYWRRKKIEQIGWEKFSREYPSTVEEAYAQLGDSYLKRQDLEHVEILKVDSSEQLVFAERNMNDKYAMGVDVSAGVGRDYSVLFVLSKLTNQPVYIYRTNKVPPVSLARKIQEVATAYGDAKVLIESNNMGGVVLNELRHLGYTKIWLDSNEKDWVTTLKTKTLMFEMMKQQISCGQLRVVDNITFSELRALTVNEKGHIVIPDNLDGHGDSAVALALATVCLNSISLPKTCYLPEWVGNRKAKKIRDTAGVAVAKYKRY